MDKVDCVIAGAGVVGLAIGRELALAGREVLVLESADAIGTGVSSRNSEVIHAGIYYPTGSLKARLCVEGRHQLYSYCNERGIAAPRIGKLIVATQPQHIEALSKLKATALANDVPDMMTLTADEAIAMEPQLSCIGALHSPSTGIIDSHALMLSFQGDIENANPAGMVVCNSPVTAVDIRPDGFAIAVGGDTPMNLLARSFINCAGLDAVALARMISGLEPVHIPQSYLAKGHYYSLSGVKQPFGRLIYPVPQYSGSGLAGLGIHATIDLGGQVRFGPDVEWVDAISYDPDTNRAASFYDSIRTYWPGLPDGALMASYTGIRPKIVGPGEPAADFRIDGQNAHCIPGLVNLFGIESPGLTSSMAIARHVAALLR